MSVAICEVHHVPLVSPRGHCPECRREQEGRVDAERAERFLASKELPEFDIHCPDCRKARGISEN